MKKYRFECPVGRISLMGRIDNRVKIPGGTAAVSAEALRRTKVGHWEHSPEKARRGP